MDLINDALIVEQINFRNQVVVGAILLLVIVVGFLLAKISGEDWIFGLTIFVVVLLFFVSFFITIKINEVNKAAAFAAIEKAGPDAKVSTQIKSYLNGSAVPLDSWYLRAAYDHSDTERRILMTYAFVFEEKTGKTWDRELVYWDVYFEKIVRPLLVTKYVVRN